jgi:ubiquitin-conjugating enzyme E2 F
MLTLKKKIEEQKQRQQTSIQVESRVSIRDSLLVKEVQEMEMLLPRNNRVSFEDPNLLHSFTLSIRPDDGYWQGGSFKFHIEVPEDYNIVVCFILASLDEHSSMGVYCYSFTKGMQNAGTSASKPFH